PTPGRRRGPPNGRSGRATLRCSASNATRATTRSRTSCGARATRNGGPRPRAADPHRGPPPFPLAALVGGRLCETRNPASYASRGDWLGTSYVVEGAFVRAGSKQILQLKCWQPRG